MIEIDSLNYAGSKPEVFFRFRGIDMSADLDPGVIAPVVIRGSAAGFEVDIRFSEYKKLQDEINRYVASRNDEMANKRKHITQPEDWWEAFKAEADRQGVSLAEWLGEAGKAQLPKRIAAKLSDRPPANRPKKPRNER